uniref:Nudix hydrolase domain-containing protein n=1 Tax=Syphacia muris TaxID=451379 RepID=A0A0N5AQY0_9BILA
MTLRIVRRFSNMPLFGEAIREQFVERVQQEHTCWSVETADPSMNASKNVKKSCAVLIPLVNIRDKPCMLFTQRALILRNYRGAVCFPGGHLEPNECPEQGALRESFEEIGLHHEKVNVWGKLRPVYNSHLKCQVTPVVGMIKEDDLKKLKAEFNEVRSVFVVSVGELCSNKSYTKFKFG